MILDPFTFGRSVSFFGRGVPFGAGASFDGRVDLARTGITRFRFACQFHQPTDYIIATFPHGTEFRGTYKGKAYSASIEDGALLAEGKPARGLSHAIEVATGNEAGGNGWLFWQCKRPGESDFKLVDHLRKKT